MPKKQQSRVSPLRPGRRVRWTFEVSADVGAENRARVKKPTVKKSTKKQTRTRPVAQRASRSSPPQLQAANEAVTSPAAAATVPTPAPVVATQPTPESSSSVERGAVLHQPPAWQPTRGQMAGLAGVAVLVIALVAVPQPPPASETARSEQQPEQRDSAAHVANPSSTTAAPAPPAATMDGRPVVKTRALTEASKKSSVLTVTNRNAEPTKPPSLASVAETDNVALTAESVTRQAVPETTPAGSSSSGANVAPVTITGCLEISTDGNEFRLADTEGTDAPKARSWRTGFLKKRTAPVALVGALDPLTLKKSVGTRVAATGVLTNRALQVSSVRALGSSCN